MKKPARKTVVWIAAVAASVLVATAGLGLTLLHGHGPDGPPQRDMAVDAAVRREVIEAAIASLDKSYVFPEQATLIGAQLRERLTRGDFDALNSAAQFAQTLGETLRTISHDKHLEVRYSEQPIPPQEANIADSPAEQAAELVQEQRFNGGFANVSRLQGDIGYIDLHKFWRPQFVADKVAASMALLSDTHALIIDLRHCEGGDPESVMLVASYLFDQPTHLNDIYWREENRTEARWTTENVPGKRYGSQRKVWLLTSDDTFSGCEDFAYALKNAGRATLVGETTGGGAHAGDPHRLSEHFMMFVPSGRPINPVTHTDWEGVGVVPDVPTSAKKALDLAQIVALKALIANESDAEWKQRLADRLADLE